VHWNELPPPLHVAPLTHVGFIPSQQHAGVAPLHVVLLQLTCGSVTWHVPMTHDVPLVTQLEPGTQTSNRLHAAVLGVVGMTQWVV